MSDSLDVLRGMLGLKIKWPWLADEEEEQQDKPKVRGNAGPIAKPRQHVVHSADFSRKRRQKNQHKQRVQAAVRSRHKHGRQRPASHKVRH